MPGTLRKYTPRRQANMNKYEAYQLQNAARRVDNVYGVGDTVELFNEFGRSQGVYTVEPAGRHQSWGDIRVGERNFFFDGSRLAPEDYTIFTIRHVRG
jgi:hypothetical protein